MKTNDSGGLGGGIQMQPMGKRMYGRASSILMLLNAREAILPSKLGYTVLRFPLISYFFVQFDSIILKLIV